MRKGTRSIETATDDGDVGPYTTTTTFLLPTDAYVTLRFVRDELKLLASLAEPRSDDDRDEIVVSTEALSDCFGRIAEQLDGALVSARRFD